MIQTLIKRIKPPAGGRQQTITDGRIRWSVKTGADPEAARITTLTATPTSIFDLSLLPRPRATPPNGRITGPETTNWKVSATLVAYHLEADGDIHLVLADSRNSLIAEAPDPSQITAPSPWIAAITQVRTTLISALRPAANNRHCSIPITVTGPAFFDHPHGQAGAAPNSIEIHPILTVTLAKEPA